MRRQVYLSSGFERAAKSFVKTHSQAAPAIDEVILQLQEDALAPSLRTHKLKGKLAGLWACSAGYDLRIVFKFVEFQGEEVVLLVDVGTHDEVY